MLNEQNIITTHDCRNILKGLLKLEHDDIFSKELDTGTDLYMNLETLLIQTVGDVGGKMHIARSRNDIIATVTRMVARHQILETCNLLIRLIETTFKVIRENYHTIMPGYTHWQHAQPVTLAHYFSGITQALMRDTGRLMAAYRHADLCPLGACALATTGFPVDRDRTAYLLGFEDILENSYDAVASRDFLAEFASALGIMMVTLSRLAEDLIIWNTYEFSTAMMPDEFSATSSIMPQKKNPIVLEHIKGRAGHVISSVTGVLTILKGTSFSHNREVSGETSVAVNNAFELSKGCLEMFVPLIPRISFDRQRLFRNAAQGLSTVTELADLLVRTRDISFRKAHEIVGMVVNELLDKSKGLEELRLSLLDSAFHKVMGCASGLSQNDIVKALDPEHNVSSRRIKGGPEHGAVKSSIARQKEELKEVKRWMAKSYSRLGAAQEICSGKVGQIINN